ncbi:MAG: hypothetical protein FWE32_05130 [Oscillospiraceae bacterium]|nr:hypothetical protein [Oscillospiraceae bacterium]
MITRIFSNLRSPLIAGLVALAGIGLIAQPAGVTQGILSGLRVSGQVLIPALFPFMALSTYMVLTDSARILSIPLRPITKYLLRLPGECGAVVLAALIGGYPVGAKMISTLRAQNRLDNATSKRMTAFCFGTSPSFLIVAVGGGMLADRRAGVALFIAQIIASLAVGLIFSRGVAVPRERREPAKLAAGENAFVTAVTGASSAMLNMCAFAVLFSGLLYMVGGSGIYQWLVAAAGIDPALAITLLAGLFEVTSGSVLAAELGGMRGVFLLGVFASWGGLSVIFQVAAILGERMPWRAFLFGRAIHAGLAGLLSLAFYSALPAREVAVIALPAVRPVLSAGGSNWLTALCLLAMCAMLTTNTGRKSP